MYHINQTVERDIQEALSEILPKLIKDEATCLDLLQNHLVTISDKILAVLPQSAVLQVKDFHSVFGHPINNKPTFFATQFQKRYGYIKEELDELQLAIDRDDIVLLGDTYIDLLYFIFGGLVESGLWPIAGKLFDEVHRSNMSKCCKTSEEAQATKKYWEENGQGTCAVYPISIGGFVVKRESDGKVMKSINYSEPDLKSIIDEANGLLQGSN